MQILTQPDEWGALRIDRSACTERYLKISQLQVKQATLTHDQHDRKFHLCVMLVYFLSYK